VDDPKIYQTPHVYRYYFERAPAVTLERTPVSYALEEWCDAGDPRGEAVDRAAQTDHQVTSLQASSLEVKHAFQRYRSGDRRLALASASLAAHHSFAMFEMDKDVEYRGVVREWKWQKPARALHGGRHEAAGVDPQTVGVWDVEGGSVNIMTRQGWTRASYKAGRSDPAGGPSDEGRVQGHLALLCDSPGRHAVVPRHRPAQRRREEDEWRSSVACRTARSRNGSSDPLPSGRIRRADAAHGRHGDSVGASFVIHLSGAAGRRSIPMRRLLPLYRSSGLASRSIS
jgi:hypothetical protein